MPKSGIVGLPNVGKSTLFNALTKTYAAKAENFAFCTIEPNLGIVEVPDPRVGTLAKIFSPAKVIYANFEFFDIAGLVKGAHAGQGLGNQFLAQIREVDSIVHLLRCFEDSEIQHVENRVDPVQDLETILLELRLADLAVVQKRAEKIKKQKENQQELELLKKITKSLEDLEPLNLTQAEALLLRHLNLLSLKPFLLGANLQESDLANPLQNSHYQELLKYLKTLELRHNLKIPIVPLSAQIEVDLLDLEAKEAREYLEDLGVKSSGVPNLIEASFQLLDLISFFTAGEKEVRAWTIKQNSTALEAAGVIHTDFQKGFIKAEIVSFEDFIRSGSKTSARETGKLRLEGREYLIQSGDIVEFRFNL